MYTYSVFIHIHIRTYSLYLFTIFISIQHVPQHSAAAATAAAAANKILCCLLVITNLCNFYLNQNRFVYFDFKTKRQGKNVNVIGQNKSKY